MRAAAVVLTAVAAAVPATARPAHACSGPWGIGSRVSLPDDGATDVPTNVEIRVKYIGAAESVPHALVLRHPDGAAVELESRGGASTSYWWVDMFAPVSELDPNTTYELADFAVVPCDDWDCAAAEPQIFATFTTGRGPDTTPPTFLGLSDVDSSFDPGDPSDSCGYYSSVSATLSWAPAKDDGSDAWIRYRVYGDTGRRYAAFLEGTGVRGEGYCAGESDFWPIGASISVPVGPVLVRAVDLAGNEDSNTVYLETASCEAWPPPDAGVGGDSDAGSGADGPGGGCGCAVARVRAFDVFPWLLGVLACWGLRRRRAGSTFTEDR